MTPDFSRGYLRIPLTVWRSIYCQGPLTRRQLQLVSVVIRETWGWMTAGGEVRAWTRPLTARQFAEATGLSTDHIGQDLRRLVALGVLREQSSSYQFEPEVGLWKTLAPTPPKPRRTPPNLPVLTAESALPTPDVKTGKIEERNVPPPTRSSLSPGGDNSLRSSPANVVRLPFAVAQPATDDPAGRFVRVVTQFVGDLPGAEIRALDAWITDVGITAAWNVLGPDFRQGSQATREAVRRFVEPYLLLTDPVNEDEGRPGA